MLIVADLLPATAGSNCTVKYLLLLGATLKGKEAAFVMENSPDEEEMSDTIKFSVPVFLTVN